MLFFHYCSTNQYITARTTIVKRWAACDQLAAGSAYHVTSRSVSAYLVAPLIMIRILLWPVGGVITQGLRKRLRVPAHKRVQVPCVLSAFTLVIPPRRTLVLLRPIVARAGCCAGTGGGGGRTRWPLCGPLWVQKSRSASISTAVSSCLWPKSS